jgi:hypothetical protein
MDLVFCVSVEGSGDSADGAEDRWGADGGETGDSKACVLGSSFIRGSCVLAPVDRVLCFLLINATDCANRKCRTDVIRVKNW